MLKEIIKKFVTFNALDGKVYASDLWPKLISILNPEAIQELTEKFQDKIPLQVIVDFTQANFLRKQHQRWALDNYNDFSAEKKASLEQLLNEFGQLDAQSFPGKSDYALFLGTSTANLAKRAFYIFDEIVNRGAKVDNFIILGTDEPYDQYMDSICKIVESNPKYFKEALTVEDVPKQATMHEVMVFLFENLRWPSGKKPNAIRLSQERPCNTNKEIDAVSSFFRESGVLGSAVSSSLFAPSPDRCQVTVLSHQPFNDRQAIVTLTGLSKANLQDKCDISVAGAGLDTYPTLNQFPASTMSPAQIVDNLSRALYEINQNVTSLFVVEDVESAATASSKRLG